MARQPAAPEHLYGEANPALGRHRISGSHPPRPARSLPIPVAARGPEPGWWALAGMADHRRRAPAAVSCCPGGPAGTAAWIHSDTNQGMASDLGIAAGFPVRLILSSALLILAVVVLRSVAARFIRSHVQSADLRRRWLVQTRNGMVLLLVLGLVMIWAEELRTVAISIVAIAVAFVVATKELILCITGSILKMASRSFVIGDRIQVKDFRGDVIDQNLLATTILEVGPGKLTHQRTGRMAVIPNSLFVSEPVINESFTEDYVLHVFTVPFKREDNWQLAQTVLLDVTRAQCGPFLEIARRYMRRLGDRRGLEVPVVDPRVSIQVPVAGELHLVVRFPCRPSQRSAIEQAILTEVFTTYDFQAVKKTTEASEPKPAQATEEESSS